MNLDWQDVVTIGLVGLAIAYLSYRTWKVVLGERSAGCSTNTCKSCPSGTNIGNVQEKPFVSVDQLSQRTREVNH